LFLNIYLFKPIRTIPLATNLLHISLANFVIFVIIYIATNQSRNNILEKNKGIMRLFYAGLYSWQGLKSAWANEAAVKQEIILLLVLTILSFIFDITTIERLAMIASIMLVLIVELLNSAIECIVDRVSTEHHILSGRAKDYGSLAVLLSLIIAASTWIVILLT
jgi:diacylglycerol kinase (ATP)